MDRYESSGGPAATSRPGGRGSKRYPAGDFRCSPPMRMGRLERRSSRNTRPTSGLSGSARRFSRTLSKDRVRVSRTAPGSEPVAGSPGEASISRERGCRWKRIRSDPSGSFSTPEGFPRREVTGWASRRRSAYRFPFPGRGSCSRGRSKRGMRISPTFRGVSGTGRSPIMGFSRNREIWNYGVDSV